jgi:hypothetical protein
MAFCPTCRKLEFEMEKLSRLKSEAEQRKRDIADQEAMFAASAKRLQQRATAPSAAATAASAAASSSYTYSSPPSMPSMPSSRAAGKADPYLVLGLTRGVSLQVVKARWHTLARELHPDKNVHRDGDAFSAAKDAYDAILKSLVR